MECTCGNDKFKAHQVCYIEIIVNKNNRWESNYPNDKFCCYNSYAPFGPYKCTKCGKEYDEI